MTEPSPPVLAAEFLAAVRRGEPTADLRSALANLPESALAAMDRDAATAFWLDVYNGYVQYHLDRKPSLYDSKRRFFGGKRIRVAGHQLSLDDIEHGLLRGSKSKYGLGYLPRLRPSAFERRHRLADADPRIHFAVNCGAVSCPPILTYSAERIDAELDVATTAYLENETRREHGALSVPRLLLYYRGDFGGRAGIYAFLERHGVLEPGERPKIRYRSYDWTRQRGQYGDGHEKP